ncbi:methyltransferase-domain-containing protein [Chytridium lagenaria]|nr:methyltransferase-domain-containing protein [Chytridium lagenaria]
MGVEGQKTKRKRKSGGSSKIVKSKGKKSNLATNLGIKSPVKAVQSPLKTEKKTPADPKLLKAPPHQLKVRKMRKERREPRGVYCIRIDRTSSEDEEKLAGGNFRFINEKLYTTKSDESFKLFKSSPSLFDVELKSRKQSKNSLVIADLGCGEAKLSESLLQSNPKTGTPLFVVHSFDLVAPNERVVACDIRKVPMKDATVDVAIFCLAILKPDGELKIAEVTSRFPDVKNFVAALESIGFKLRLKDESNKMFIMFNFVKLSKKKSTVRIENPEELLTPCIYKKR